jgi:hypothetical protein
MRHARRPIAFGMAEGAPLNLQRLVLANYKYIERNSVYIKYYYSIYVIVISRQTIFLPNQPFLLSGAFTIFDCVKQTQCRLRSAFSGVTTIIL